MSAPASGTLIADKYRVERVLASGGMGVIVEAEHAALGQRVAIKFLLPEGAENAELVERFLREARAAARLRSDHVVKVFDIGTDDRGVPFMVMELLEGNDLSAEISTRGPLPVAEATSYIVEALDAIVEAHAAGIVHRDLKPSNLFLTGKAGSARRIRVLDFGISKISAGADAVPNAVLTSTKSMLGSPGYMSPEQVRSTKSVDARTDIWALGVILYELLTGAPAFRGETLGDIFAKIREEDLPPIQSHRPDVPAGLAAVLAGCLQRDREKRIPTAVAMRDRLLPFASGRERTLDSIPDVERPPDLANAVTLAAPDTTEVEPPRLAGETLATWTGDPSGKRRSRLLWGSLLAVAALAGGGVFWLVRSPERPATAPSHDGVTGVQRSALLGAGTQSAAPTSSAPVVTVGEPTASASASAAATPPATATASATPTATAAASHGTQGAKPAAHVPAEAKTATPHPTVTPAEPLPHKKPKEDLGI